MSKIGAIDTVVRYVTDPDLPHRLAHDPYAIPALVAILVALYYVLRRPKR